MKFSPLSVLGICLFSVVTPSLQGAITLTTFGSSAAPTFLVDDPSTSFADTQIGNSITIVGSDFGSQLGGTFGPLNIIAETGLTGLNSVLILSGTMLATAPNSIFTVALYDDTLNPANRAFYQGNWTDLSDGVATLSFLNITGAFNFGTVSGLELSTAGSGSTVNASLNLLQASAIPEPSRLFLIGLAGLGLAMRRRRSISV